MHSSKTMKNNELYHFGIKGMKWGVRRFENEDGTLTDAGKSRYRVPRSTIRRARKDAKEYARAKMFYGEGAGTRRKLINATVKQRSVDPDYKKEFDRYLAKQDMAKHASKARGERHRKDVVKSTAKTARGIKNMYLGNYAAVPLGAAAIYGAAKYVGADKKAAQYVKTGAKKVADMFKTVKYRDVARAFRGGR